MSQILKIVFLNYTACIFNKRLTKNTSEWISSIFMLPEIQEDFTALWQQSVIKPTCDFEKLTIYNFWLLSISKLVCISNLQFQASSDLKSFQSKFPV